MSCAVKHSRLLPLGRWPLSWFSSSFHTGLSRALTAVTAVSAPGRMRATGALILALASCSCAGRPLQGVLIPAAESAEVGSRIPVLIATTREKSTSDPGEMFNSERGLWMSYGQIAISIPPDDSRKIGDIQWPSSPPGDPHRDFVDCIGRVH